MKLIRRARRSLTLAMHWIRYLAPNTRRGTASRRAISHFLTWARTTLLRQSLEAAAVPWFTLPCSDWLLDNLRSDLRVFEWGSGASTLFFLRHGCTVTSVEHDADWYRRVRADAERAGRRLDLRLRTPSEDSKGSMDGGSKYEAYVAEIDEMANASVDVVVVDGRARADCVERARPKVAPGGFLILDDSHREQYLKCLDVLPREGWQIHHFEGPRPASVWPVFSRTTVAVRKVEGPA